MKIIVLLSIVISSLMIFTSAVFGQCASETFSSIPASSGSYSSNTWVGNNSVSWTANDSRTDQVLNGRAIALRTSTLKNNTSIPGGCGVISFDYERVFSGNSILKVFVNGTQFGGDINVTSTSTSTFTATVNVTGNINVEIRNSGNRVIVDDLKWTCYTIATPCTHTVTSFSPANGPEGTIITINGTGFTSSSTVEVNDNLLNTTFVNSTTLKAEVVNGTTSGNLVVKESGCVVATGVFTVNIQEGTCSTFGVGTDVFISEVYDSDSYNNWYMELYNPTNSPINLSNYQIKRYANTSTSTVSRLINLSGTIPPNSVFLLNLGDQNECGLSYDFVQSGGGINGGNKLELVKNNVVIDVVNTPSGTGYTQIRNPSVTSPNSTYTSSEWTNRNNESCSDLGTHNYSSFTPLISPITDNSICSSISYSFTASLGSNPMTYQWFFNDGTSTSWVAVSIANLPGFSILGATSNNLVINSNTSSVTTLSNYQFYCKVTTSGCSFFTNAISFQSSQGRFFRSKTSGNWNAIASWENATSISGPWIAACDYPTDVNSDYISIQNSHTIIVNLTLSADQIIVQANGVLQLNEKLTVPNGNATTEDLLVLGTLNDYGSSTKGIDFVAGATWLLGVNGTICKTWSSSVNKYRDNYFGGISTIPATAKWIYRYNTNDNVVTSTIGMYYPNLYFESSSGHHEWDANLEVLNGSSNTAVIKGSLYVGMTNTGTVEVYNNNTNSNTITVFGNVYIGSGSKLLNTNLSCTNCGNGTGFEIKGDSIVVNGVYQIDNAGIGKTILSGTNQQHIVSTSSTGIFNASHFELNNGNGVKINQIDINISSNLVFVNGIIYTDILQTDKVNITNNSPTAIVGGEAQLATNKYVDGKLQWNVIVGNTYRFPIGSDRSMYGAQGFEYAPISGSGQILSYLETNSTTLVHNYAYCDIEKHLGAGIVNVGNGLPGYDGILDQMLFDLHSPLQWNITNPAGGISNYNITMLASGNQDISPVVSANNLPIRYLMKNGEPGDAGVATTTAEFTEIGFDKCPNQYTLTGLTSFSRFTLDGATQGATVLPVELIVFDGELLNDFSANLFWQTATEIDNDYFTLEHSLDGYNFESIATVKGGGNTISTNNYDHVHNRLSNGNNYYRLWSTDYDGKRHYRGIVVLSIQKTESYFNSITSTIELSEKSDVEIYSPEGKLVMYSKNSNSIPFNRRGVFLIHQINNGTTERILIKD